MELLGISRQGPAGAHGIADVVVAEDVAGTNDHREGGPVGDADVKDIEGLQPTQKEKPEFEAIPN